MNEELKTRLTGFLDAVEHGAEFAKEQMPLVAQECLNLAWASSMLGICLGLAGILLTIAAIIWACKSKIDEAEQMFVCMWSAFFCFIATVVLCFNIYFAVKVTVAPRVVLLEKVASLVHEGQ